MNSWIIPDLLSAFFLGLYDTSKKASVKNNQVFPVLFWATVFGTLFYVAGILCTGRFSQAAACTAGQYGLIWIKSLIVASSWYFGFAALVTLPLSLAAPVRATAPLWTFIGSLLLYKEVPTLYQGLGMLSVFCGYAILNAWSSREGFSFKKSQGMHYCCMGTLLGAVSSLFDKFILNICHIPPLTVQFYFSINLVVIFGIGLLFLRICNRYKPAQWRWTIPATGVCLILADFAFFQAVSLPGIQISQVSLVRRSSCLITFAMSALVFKEKHLGGKAMALLLIILGIAIIALSR